MHIGIFDKAISGYQKQIGLYDREQWECMIEERQLKNFRRIRRLPSKKVGTLVNLVDIEDVRASFHSKTNPHSQPHGSWYALTWKGFIRTMLFPLYFSWWRSQVGALVWCLLLLYSSQVASTITFLRHSDSVEQMSSSEAFFPVVLMLVLGILQNHISCTDNAHKALSHHGQTAKKFQMRPSDHENLIVWHDDDVTLANQDCINAVSVDQDTLPSVHNQPVSRVIASTSPNRVEFDFPLEENIEPKVSKSESERICEDTRSTSNARNNFLESTRRGSITGGDSRGESDNESDNGNSDSKLCYKTASGEVQEIIAYSGDINEPASLSMKEEAIVGSLISPKIFECSVSAGKVSSSSSSDSERPKTRIDNKMLNADELDNIRRGSQADDSAFSETSAHNGASSYKPVSEIEQQHVLSLIPGSCLISRHGSSTSSSAGVPVRNGSDTQTAAAIDRVSEWRRSASISNGPANSSTNSLPLLMPGSGNLRRRKGSGKSLNITNEQPDQMSSSRISLNLGSDPLKAEGIVSSNMSFKPILRNRMNSRKTSSNGAEPIEGVVKRSQNGIAASCTTVPNRSNRRRGVIPKNNHNLLIKRFLLQSSYGQQEDSWSKNGTTTDDTEWDMHTEYPSDSNSTTESDITSSDQTKNLQQENFVGGCSKIPPSSNAVASSQEGHRLNVAASTENAPVIGEYGFMPHSSNKISCLFWDTEGCKKVEMALTDLGRILIDRVQRSVSPGSEYAYVSACFAVLVAVVPVLLRLYQLGQPFALTCISSDEPVRTFVSSIPSLNFSILGDTLFSSQRWETALIFNGIWQRFWLSLMFFFLLCVAENTFKQRVSYAKHFSYLTSAHRARRCDLPHFRLNKVRNIKTWLTLRAYIKRLGPQRPVDIIVSFSFVLSIVLLSLLTFWILRDSSTFMTDSMHWELAFWLFVLAVFLLRFMTLGTKVNRKYRSLSVLITEQINLYLQMEEKPEKKESLMNANNALKLAEELIKELESPFKISGLAANPILYNISKVVLLSAFSAVATELVGFKLKLYKIKIPSA